MAAKVKDTTTDVPLDVSDGAIRESESKKEKKLREKEEKESKKQMKKEAKKDKKKKGGGKVIPILVAIVLLGLIAATLYFNLFSLRSKYLGGILEKIPLVNNLVTTDIADPDNPYASYSKEELQDEIKRLEQELDVKSKELEDMVAMNKMNSDQITSLQEVQTDQLQFKADQLAFEKMITENDPNAYAAFYASISSENAPELAAAAEMAAEEAKEFKKYINTIQSMSEKNAAKMLEEMISTDMDLVVLILKNVDNELAGGILSAMTPANSASVIKQMAPAAQ